MKKLRLIRYFILAAFIMPLLATAQFTDTKEIYKTYAVLPETQIEILNKYGKIEIKTWDKDSVTFNIKIRVEEKKLSKLEESIRGIDFDITNSDHYLIVRTDVAKNKSSLSKEFNRFKETLLKSDGNIQVDYLVWMPESNRLKIENKFGDIYIGDYKGETDINLSNGNLKAHNFESQLNMTLNFANASLNSIKKGRLDCNFSELFIRNAETLRITSKSTEFEFAEIQNLDADSRRDRFRIRHADNVEVRSSFSSFRINDITDKINLRSEYGDIDIDKVAPGFNSMNIESKSMDINIYFEPETSFNFEITNTKANFDYSSNFEIVDTETFGDKDITTIVKGYFKEKSESTPKLLIKANSGTINLRSN
ncbi:hypothetical protein OU798_08215 [Prolixibacteraceae bacterium Z1-6]|uniref:Adhesin domain-containing protein n=1 Tax=Draconibacterium aestuarii TaxID=2998507 RepID=A0A9X3F4D3_9BACT|nr:hypothetical protein [Prolixibacteraceae bacterium Z1-6]